MKLPEKQEQEYEDEFIINRGPIAKVDDANLAFANQLREDWHNTKPAFACRPNTLKANCIQRVIIYPDRFQIYNFKGTPYIIYEAYSLGMEYEGDYLIEGRPLDMVIPFKSWDIMMSKAGILRYFMRTQDLKGKAVQLHFIKQDRRSYELRYCAILEPDHDPAKTHPSRRHFKKESVLFEADNRKRLR
jgi:hypothetical protein